MDSALLISVIISARDLASAAFARLGATAMSWQAAMTMGALAVGAGLVVTAGAAIKLATDFDQVMHKIGGLTSEGASKMEYYKEQILSIAPAIDMGPTALAKALYFVISANFHGADAINVLALSAKMAATTMSDQAGVADLLTTTINAYRGANVSAGHAADDLIKLVVNGKVEMTNLLASFGFVAVTARNAGLSLDETSAAVSALSQISGAHGARRVMLDLDFALRALGIRLENVSAHAMKMKGLKEPWDAAKFAMMDFGQKLDYMARETGGIGYIDKVQAQAYMATGNLKNLAQATAHANANFMTLAGGAAAFLPLAMLLNDKLGSYNTILKQMGGNGQAVDQAFAVMRQSTAQQTRMFEIMGQTILTQIGLNILPMVNQLLGGLYKVGQAVNSFIATKSGWETLKYAVIGIAIVVGTILAHAIVGLVVAAAPLTLAIVGIVAGGILLGKIIQLVVQHFGGWDAILRRIHPIIVMVQQAFAEAGNAIKKALADPAIQAAWKQLQAALPGLLPILKAIAIVIGVALFIAFKVVEFAILAVLKVLPLLINWWAFLATALGDVAKVVMWVFDGKHWTDLWNAIVKAAQQFGTAVLNAILAPFRAIGAAFVWLYNHNVYVKALVDGIVRELRNLVTRAQYLVRSLVDWIGLQWQNLVTIATTIWTSIVQHILKPIQDAWTKITTAIQQDIIDPVKQKITGLVQDALNWGSAIITNLITGIKTQLGNLGAVVGNVAQGIKNKLGFHSPAKEGPGADADQWAPNLMRMYASGILAGIPHLASAANQAAQALAMGMLAGAAGGASISLAGMGGGGTTNIMHNWAGAFPSVTSAAQVEQVFNRFADQRERRTYRRTRRAGYGGGQRAGW